MTQPSDPSSTPQSAPIGDYRSDDMVVTATAGRSPKTFYTESASLHTPRSFDENPLFCLADIKGYTRHLSGRLKTLIDGTIADPTQRKALKDLIHTMLWKEHYEPTEQWAYSAADDRSPRECPPLSKTSVFSLEERYGD